jgi:hypothetical protein
VWTVNGNLGFAKNRAVANFTNTSTLTSPSYTSWYLGLGASRPIGRSIDLSFSYYAAINQPDQPGCIGVGCNSSSTQNTVVVFMRWHARPFVLE